MSDNKDSLNITKHRIFLDALNGDPAALERIVASDNSAVFGDGYSLYREMAVPINFTAENAWTPLASVPSGTPPSGKYAVEIQASWSIDSSNSRASGIRVLVNGVPGESATRETSSPLDIASVSSFSDFSVDGKTEITISIEGILESGGGAAEYTLHGLRFRFYQVDTEGGVTPAEIIVPGA